MMIHIMKNTAIVIRIIHISTKCVFLAMENIINFILYYNEFLYELRNI